MSRTWINRLCQRFLGSSNNPRPSRRPAARPTLELLEGRDVPSPLGATSLPMLTVPHGNLHPIQVLTTPSIPNPATLAGKIVRLGEPGNPSNQYGILGIQNTTLQADGSYTFQGVYMTSVWDVKDANNQPAIVNVTG